MTRRQTAFRLDARLHWPTVLLDHVAARGAALTLAPLPGTARPLAAPSGAFAGLATPMTVATAADGALFILDGAGHILHYDPCRERFEPLACLQSGVPGLRKPRAITVHPAGELLIIDGETRRISAVALATQRIRRHWGPFAWAGERLTPTPVRPVFDPVTGVPTGAVELDAAAWDPRDIGVLPDGRIVVSDRAAERIHVFDRRGQCCASLDGSGAGLPPLYRPGALAIDRAGRIYVVEEDRATVAILDLDHGIVARTDEVESLRDRFAEPAVAVDDDGTIWIGNRLTGVTEIVRCDCAGLRLAPEPAPLTPAGCAFLAFDADGRPILGDPRSPCLMRSDTTRYATEGHLIFAPQDAGQARMVWDRLALEGSAPIGTRLTIATFTTEAQLSITEVDTLAETAWVATPVVFEADGGWSAAVRSAPGRFLWIRLDFVSDGSATPSLRSLTVTCPRDTSIRYLPGCFSADAFSADFLARFMGLFDEARDDFFAPLDRLPAYFDPLVAPAADAGASGADFLDWLAGWIGISLDREWSVARRRRLVAAAPQLFKIRGTVAGLKRHIAVYTGIEPRVVEHFRLRRWLSLDEARLGDDTALWGPEIIKRLQLDAYSEIGRFALVDGGDPLTDPFDAFAHRATLYVPAGDGFTDADRAALEDVVEAAKPAHVDVDIRLMRPRFVIGCELVLGVNSVLGRDVKPARTDDSILGEDIRLAPPPSGFSLSPGLRLGVDTTLD
jgi:phage tail-like protein